MPSEFEIEFDPVKDAKNLAKHGLSLTLANEFEWDVARINEDLRRPYLERRFKASSMIEERLRELVYCLRGGLIRVISMRKSNPREIKKYANSN